MTDATRRRRWYRRMSLAMIATAALGLSACAGGDDDGGESSGGGSAEQGPIEFGYLNALTGDFAVAGKPELQGVQLAVRHINEAGGVCGRQLELAATQDDQGQANLAVAGLRKLVQQENQKIIIGPGITPPGLATAPVAEQLKVWFMLETAQREPWEGREYVFSNISPQDTYSPLIADYLEQQMEGGGKEVAIVYANIPYGQAGQKLLLAEAEERGWDVTVNEGYDPSQFKFTSQAQKIAQSKPDGVLMWGAATPGDAQVLKQIRQSGYDGPMAGDVALSLPFVPEIAGQAAETIVAPSQLNFVDPDAATKKFLDAYQSAYDETPTFLPGAAYDAVHIIGEAVKKNDCKTDPKALAAAMDGLDYRGVTGEFKYTKEYRGGPQADSFRPVTFRDGEYAVPDDVK